jgi:hypothetical protein
MKRAFMLTHVALIARDAADRQVVLPVEPQEWDAPSSLSPEGRALG